MNTLADEVLRVKLAEQAGWAVLATGPTTWPAADSERLAEVLGMLPAGSVVIQGGAAGFDALADVTAKRLGLYRVTVPYHGAGGRGGGPMRNGLMVRLQSGLVAAEGMGALVVAGGPPLSDGGTADCVRRAERAGREVLWIAPRRSPR